MGAQVELPLLREVYSDAEPVTRAAQAHGHRMPPTVTLNTGYDFRRKADRDRAFAEVRRLGPFCLVIAFPCNPWSSIRNFAAKRGCPRLAALRAEHRALVQFAVTLARYQMFQGRHFIIENPQLSQVWQQVQSLAQLREDPNVHECDFEQCMYGAVGERTGEPIRKATRFITSSAVVAEHFLARCSRDHDHERLEGGNTRAAAIYPRQMAREMVQCVERQWDRDHFRGFCEARAADGVEEVGPPAGAEFFGGNNEPADNEDDDLDDGEEEDDDQGASAFDPPGPKGQEAWDKLSSGQKQALLRLHANTGHRPVRVLARALVIAGASRDIVAAARALRCEVCDESRRVRPARPAHLPRARAFGDVVHIDLVDISQSCGFRPCWCVSIVDAASGFQVVRLLARKTSTAVIEAIEESWTSWGGAPVTMVADVGPEFASEEFLQWCEGRSCRLHTARWRPRGRTAWQSEVAGLPKPAYCACAVSMPSPTSRP